MKKFVDKTNSLKEPAIKIGSSVPREAVNLGWYSSKEVSPKNNVIITDVSSLIPENITNFEETEKILYANELGVLEDNSGTSYFDFEKVYLSNVFLDERNPSQTIIQSNAESANYAMSYYVTRHFTLINSASYVYQNLNSFIDQTYVPKNIKVLDANGEHYVELETGRKKYRIGLESTPSIYNYQSNEIPARIIVFLEDVNPSGFTVVYDKVEVDTNGKWFKQVLKYSETINSLPIFNNVEEESEVIDPNSFSRKIYSVKRNTKNKVLNRSYYGSDSNQIFVNTKAVEDHRRFQVFNWRIIGKINSYVNLNEVNYGNEFSLKSVNSKTVKACVLFSSAQNGSSTITKDLITKVNPYVFYNLQNSPLNLSKMSFVNPNTNEIDTTSASYWLVDIDTVSDADLAEYDVVACSLYWKLTKDQAIKINRISESYGSIVFDIANAPLDALTNLDSSFTATNAASPTYPTSTEVYNTSSVFNNSTLNNAFNLSTSEFASNCGIYGYSLTVNNQHKGYRYFSSSALQPILTKNSKVIFAHKRVINPGDSHKASNIVVSATDFLSYANDSYVSSSSISYPNNGLNTFSKTADSAISAYAEGPLQFLYNFCSVSLNDRVESSRRSQDLTSTIHYFTTPWKSDWIIDSNVLFDDEKSDRFVNRTVNGEIKLVKDIVQNPKSLYAQEIQKVIPGIREAFLDKNDSNIELFIEYTNPSVLWTNSVNLTEAQKNDIATSYNVVKVSNKLGTCSVYTNIKSVAFSIPSDFGPHVIKERARSVANDIFTVTPANQIKNYNFNFKLAHNKTVLSSAAKYLDATINLTATATFSQTKYSEIVPERKNVFEGTIEVPQAPTPGTTVSRYPTLYLASEGDIVNRLNNPLNVFSYTGDIDAGNTSSSYKLGSKGDYVKYISFTLDKYKPSFGITVGDNFNQKLVDSVKQFQRDYGLLVDGVVDSQTKMYLGLYWAGLSEDTYNAYYAQTRTPQVQAYIREARNTKWVNNALTSGWPAKLINFTGVDQKKDPTEACVWISFYLSGENVDYIKDITIFPDDFSDKATSYNGIQILDYTITDNAIHTNGIGRRIDRSDKFAPLVITLNSREAKNKWINIKIKGSPLGGSFASAEGIAIDSISYNVQTLLTTNLPLTKDIYKDYPAVWGNVTKNVTGTVSLSIPVSNISATDQTINIDKQALLQYGQLNSITLYKENEKIITSDTLSYSGLSNVSLNQTSYKPGSTSEVVNLSDPQNIVIQTYSIASGSIKESGNLNATPLSSSFVVLNKPSNTTISVKSDRIMYSDPENYFYEKQISNYSLKSAVTGEIKPGSNTINYYDGPLLLCNSDGTPVVMDFSLIRASVRSSSVFNSDIEIQNTLGETPGLQYGFYNVLTNQFIGKRISFATYRDNAAYIYPGVYVYDYDGNLDTLVERTNSDQQTYEPVRVPNKIAYPVYKCVFSNTNKIQLLPMQENLKKTEPWPINVTSGSFYKDIFIPSEFKTNGLAASYLGQTLVAKYDTSNMSSIPPSKIYGRGFLDIVDETPEVIDRFTIRTRHGNIHYTHGVSSDLVSFAAPIQYAVNVYTRESVSSSWQKVNSQSIRNINAKEGIIKFLNPIISSDPQLTKISYVTKQSGIAIKHSDGVPIPTNPIINSDSIRINKPLYIYLLPKEIYKYSTPKYDEITTQDIKLELAQSNNNSSLVNFTYDNNIFNEKDSYYYNPFALLIGVVYTIDSFKDEDFTLTDLRVKGGGVSAGFTTNRILKDVQDAISYWDVYPPLTEAYPKGGYIIVKIPGLVKKNFTNPQEVYTIVRDNITAGVVFDLQDMDGKDWGSSAVSTS